MGVCTTEVADKHINSPNKHERVGAACRSCGGAKIATGNATAQAGIGAMAAGHFYRCSVLVPFGPPHL